MFDTIASQFDRLTKFDHMAKFDYKVKSVLLTKFDIKSNLTPQPNKTTYEIKFDLQCNQIWLKDLMDKSNLNTTSKLATGSIMTI